MNFVLFRRKVSFVLGLCLLVVSAAHAADSVVSLQNGVALRNRGGGTDSETFYKITVPPGATLLTVTLRGGKGDADLYLKQSSEPSTGDFDKASTTMGNKETTSMINPQPGDWFILLEGSAGYSGATLLAQFTMGQNIVAPPVILPGEGTFAGQATVQLKSPTRGATVRFTLDGSNPDALSTVYTSSITATQSTTVKARGFKTTSTPSAVSAADLVVVPTSTVTELTAGVPLTGLAGSGDSSAYFHFVVPTNDNQLVVQSIGGDGATEIFLRFGSVPTKLAFDAHTKIAPKHETLAVTNPAVGDWFVLLHGKRDFADATLLANVGVSGADLVPVASVVQPYTSIEFFDSNSCDVIEGYVQPGLRRLLRFTTENRNIGTEDVSLGSPVDNPLFEWAPCHGHYHFSGYASYRLLGTNDTVVAVGAKIGFCLEDVFQWDPNASKSSKFDCGFQGIQAGWSDVYDSSLGGQWIDITDVPSGNYQIEIEINSLHKIVESDYSNNAIRVPVQIP